MSHVEVDEVLGFVGDVGSEVTAYDTVPGGIILLVKLLLVVGSDVFLNVEFFKSNVGAINGVLLHLLVHVGVLDDCFPLSR